MRLRRASFLALLGTSALAGCAGIATDLTENPRFHDLLELPERLDIALLGAGQPMARLYPESAISPVFRQNGFDPPSLPEYVSWSRRSWRGYRLFVSGLVETPKSFDLDALRREFPRVAQITRHDCVEGWSVIGKWTGATLRDVLAECVPKPAARYVVFHCMDQDLSLIHI